MAARQLAADWSFRERVFVLRLHQIERLQESYGSLDVEKLSSRATGCARFLE
jgi:hypothetical protein